MRTDLCIPYLNQLNIFAYPVEDAYLLYAPLAGVVAEATEAEIRKLEVSASTNRREEVPDVLLENDLTILQSYYPDAIPELTILLNQKCNFTCSYCYSAHGRNNTVISDNKLQIILDYFVDVRRGKELQLVFSGGGDPVLSFDKFRYAAEYAYAKAEAQGITLHVGIVTNGSTLTKEHIDFFHRYDIDLVVSFDIIEDVHEIQRSHYKVVAKTIDSLCESGTPFGLRSSITPLNVCRQVEMVDELHHRFPLVRSAAFEAVLNKDLFPSVMSLDKFYSDFIDNFFKAQALGGKLGVSIGNTVINNVESCKERACLGKLVVTPLGDLTACSRLSSSQEDHFEEFVYGSVHTQGMEIDRKKYSKILDHDVNKDTSCGSCIAKWHCSGGCMLARLSNSEEYLGAYCRFMQSMTLRSLCLKLGRE